MLEQSVALSSSRARGRAAILPLSAGLHLVVIAAVLGASVWRVGTPVDPPPQAGSYALVSSPSLPPPPPPPPAQREAAEPQTPVRPQPDLAPEVVPEAVPEIVPEIPVTTGGEGEESPDGEAGGQPGGEPGGTPGGVEGSTTTGPVGAPRLYRPGGDVSAPVAVVRVEPEYPELARKIGARGKVILECTIDRWGHVRNVTVLRSAHPVLDEAARKAVQQWRFQPGTLGGQPVDVLFNLTVNFDLGQ